MKYRFIKAHQTGFTISAMFRVLKVSRGGYYTWAKRNESARAAANEELLEHIKKVFQESRGLYGVRRVHRQLQRQAVSCSKNRVGRLMQQSGLGARRRRRWVRTTNSDHTLPVAQNLVQRDFSPAQPDRVWGTDITYIPTREGWLYLAVVMDFYSRRIVGWCMSRDLSSRLVENALKMAAGQRSTAGTIIHSDQGCQYASQSYRQLADQLGMTPSMSRRGDCYDNAAVESFFSTLKMELVHHQQYESHHQAKQSLFEYLEVFYNRIRLHSTLGYQSPDQFEAEVA